MVRSRRRAEQWFEADELYLARDLPQQVYPVLIDGKLHRDAAGQGRGSDLARHIFGLSDKERTFVESADRVPHPIH